MQENKSEREWLKTVVAVLVALSSILGAIFTWRSLVASGSAGSNDSKGINATINVQDGLSTTNATVYQHLEGYLYFLSNREINSKVAPQAFDASLWAMGAYGAITDTVEQAQWNDISGELSRRTAEAADRAGVSQYFFVTDYLSQDGSYNSGRELSEAQAEAARYEDVDPASHFAAADRLRQKGQGLVGVLLGLAFSVWFFVLSQLLPRQWRSISLLVGIIILFLGAAIGISLEVVG